MYLIFTLYYIPLYILPRHHTTHARTAASSPHSYYYGDGGATHIYIYIPGA